MKAIKRKYYYWRDLGRKLITVGKFSEAEKNFRTSLFYAEQSGSDYLRDVGILNIAASQIARGMADDEQVRELREMFMRTRHTKISLLATYHLSRKHELQHEIKKAFFYARIALEKARKLGDPEYLANTLNHTANLLLVESHFQEASNLYSEALVLLGDRSGSIEFQLIKDNLGYCHMMQDRVEQGVKMIEEAMQTLYSLDAGPGFLVYTEMDLCYGYLELGRAEVARKHGEVALKFAERAGKTNLIKNILLLMGDCSVSLGDQNAARSFYGELASHYPGVQFAPDFLMAFDVRKVVNLRL